MPRQSRNIGSRTSPPPYILHWRCAAAYEQRKLYQTIWAPSLHENLPQAITFDSPESRVTLPISAADLVFLAINCYRIDSSQFLPLTHETQRRWLGVASHYRTSTPSPAVLYDPSCRPLLGNPNGLHTPNSNRFLALPIKDSKIRLRLHYSSPSVESRTHSTWTLKAWPSQPAIRRAE